MGTKIETPVIFQNGNETVRGIIIQFGSIMFTKLGFNNSSEEELLIKYTNKDTCELSGAYEEIIDNLKKAIYSLKKENNDNFTLHKKEIDETREKEKIKGQKEIEELKRDKIIIENRIERETNIKTSAIEEKYLKEQLHKEESIAIMKENYRIQLESKDDRNKSLEEQNNMYKAVYGKKEFENNTEQGNYGEQFIDEIVAGGLTCDKAAFIEDSSQIGGSGDRIIKFSNGKTLMIEVKNKDVITKEDRDQFEKHYQKDFEEKKCDAALFVSLATEQIPTIGNKPIVHFSSDNVAYYGMKDELKLLEKKWRIDTCISEIFYKLDKKEPEIVEQENNVEIYNRMLDTLVKQKKDYESEVKSHKNSMDKYNESLTRVKQQINELYREIRVKNIKVNPKYVDDKLYLEILINDIKKWKTETNFVFRKGPHNKQILETMTTLTDLDREYIQAQKIKLSDIE